MLNDGTLLSVSDTRDLLLGKVDAAKDEWIGRDDRAGWLRVRRCVLEATAIKSACPCCSDLRFWLQGGCGRKDCILCQHRYPRRKAREYWHLFASPAWLGHYTATMPDWMSDQTSVEESSKIMRVVGRAVASCFSPIEMVGVSVLHWTGEKRPTKPHVHVHNVWSQRGVFEGQRVRLPGPELSDRLLTELRNATGEALEISEGARQGKYRHSQGEDKAKHCLNYCMRPQGNGNEISRVRYTAKGKRTMRPFGLLEKGERGDWFAVYPEADPKLMKRLPWDNCSFLNQGCKCGRRTLELASPFSKTLVDGGPGERGFIWST